MASTVNQNTIRLCSSLEGNPWFLSSKQQENLTDLIAATKLLIQNNDALLRELLHLVDENKTLTRNNIRLKNALFDAQSRNTEELVNRLVVSPLRLDSAVPTANAQNVNDAARNEEVPGEEDVDSESDLNANFDSDVAGDSDSRGA